MSKTIKASIAYLVSFLMILSVPTSLQAQNDSAIFELESTDKGVLIPRMTTDQRVSISNPDNGLLLYDTDEDLFYYFDGGEWWPLKTTEDVLEPAPIESADSLMNIASYIQDMAKKDDVVYLVNENNGKLVAVDVSDPYNTKVLNELYTGDAIYRIAIKGNHAFVTNQEIGDIKIVNISDPANLVLDHTYSFGGSVGDYNVKFIAFYNDIGYVCVDELGAYKIHAIDFTNPTSPSAISSIAVPTVSNMKISGEYLYFSTPSGNSLRILDITNPNTLSIDASFNADGIFGRFDVEGDILVYIDDFSSGGNLNIVDVSNPLSPVLGDTYALFNYGSFISLENGIAYISVVSELEITTVDVSDYTQANFISDTPVYSDDNITMPMGSWMYIAYRVTGNPPTLTPDLEVFNIGHDAQSTFVDRDGNTIAGPWKKTNNTVHTSTAVSVGKNQADNSAILELKSTDKGFLLPRMSLAQINAISNPAIGLQVYNTDDDCIYFYKASGWQSHCGSAYDLTSLPPQNATNWVNTSSYPGVGTSGLIYEMIGDTVYIGGGTQASDFWMYFPASDTWESIANYPSYIENGISFVYNNELYVGIGHVNNSQYSDNIYKYEKSSNSWVYITTAPSSYSFGCFSGTFLLRENATASVAGDKLYIIGGEDDYNDELEDIWEYDITNNSWTNIYCNFGNFAAFDKGISFELNGDIYFGLGEDLILNAIDEMYVYSPSNYSVTAINTFPVASKNAIVFKLNGKVYAGLGTDGANENTGIYEFDPTSNSWTLYNDVGNLARTNGVGFGYNDRIHIGLGSDQIMWKQELASYVQGVNSDGETTWEPLSTEAENSFNGIYNAPYEGYPAGAEDYKAAYYYEDNDRIYLEGLVWKGSASIYIANNDLIATLPVGYRPSQRLIFAASHQGAVHRVDILTNGEIRVVQAASAFTNWVSLSGINFRQGN